MSETKPENPTTDNFRKGVVCGAVATVISMVVLWGIFSVVPSFFKDRTDSEAAVAAEKARSDNMKKKPRVFFEEEPDRAGIMKHYDYPHLIVPDVVLDDHGGQHHLTVRNLAVDIDGGFLNVQVRFSNYEGKECRSLFEYLQIDPKDHVWKKGEDRMPYEYEDNATGYVRSGNHAFLIHVTGQISVKGVLHEISDLWSVEWR